MARYSANDDSERRSKALRAWLTPGEYAGLAASAARVGAPLSDHVRQLCLRRHGDTPVVAGARRNPEAKQLADELRAIGNNLNQLARVANQTGQVRRETELDRVLEDLKRALARVIAL